MARNRKLYTALTRRGPHRVLRGQLAFAGIPGVVFTPASGFGLPGLAFGHDWLTGADHYAETCEHLASWGFVVAAPDTQRGLAPSVLTLAADLDATLDVITGVRLGQGDISVDPDRLALAGHGFGGAAAVVAAADGTRAKAVAAVFPSVTKPSAEQSAATLTIPGLVLATPDDQKSLRTDALEVAAAWDGAVLRVVEKADAAGVAERRRMLGLLGLQGLGLQGLGLQGLGFPGSSSRTQKTVRALLTGFMLFHLTGDDTYREFAEPDAVLPHTATPDPEAPAVTHEERIVALFR